MTGVSIEEMIGCGMGQSTLQELRQKDRAYHIHPFTNHVEMHRGGTHWIKSGDGCHLIDEQDRRLLDGLAGLWCVNVGYNCAAIVEAVHAQMEELPYYPSFFNSTTEPPVLLAEWLANHAPARLNKVIYSNSGSEANETALKIIRAYWKLRGKSHKRKVLSREFAYHGVTLAATSLTGLPNCTEPFDLPLENFIHVPAPYAWAARTALSPAAFGADVIARTAEIIDREGPETIAAMFVEPIQGAGGVIIPPPGYLAALRGLCRERDILFVADEVITAFGRLGVWFASEREQLDPDILNVAKGLTSGYLPLGATLVSDEIVEVIHSGGYFAHGYTYTGHPVCTAAALANLRVIESLGLVDRVRDDVGPYFQSKLAGLASHPAVGEVRGDGLIGAAELVPRGGRDALRPGMMLGLKAADNIREEGSIVRGIRDLIALAPPLIITHGEIDELFDSARRGLDRLWN
ncbi:MAG: aminotransferase [Terrimicrobiaceae bacterium]|nr:aminotransferase [Terrimicrobiaceae bacterium]